METVQMALVRVRVLNHCEDSLRVLVLLDDSENVTVAKQVCSDWRVANEVSLVRDHVD